MSRVILLCVGLAFACACGSESSSEYGNDPAGEETAGAEGPAPEPPCECEPASDPACQEMCAAQESLGTSALTNEED